MRYPVGWKVQSFDEQSKITLRGGLTSNTGMTFTQADCGKNCYTTAWDLSGFPSDGAMVQFAAFYGGPVPPTVGQAPATPFPLDYNGLGWRTDKFGNQVGSMPVLVDTGGSKYLTRFLLDVTTGPKVSDADLTSLRQIVASITFPNANTPEASPSTALPYLAVRAPDKAVKDVMDAAFHGVLVERSGCVVTDSHPTLVVWPPGYSLRTGEAGRIELVNDKGVALATLGEPTHFGGGYIRFATDDRQGLDDFLAEPIPESCEFGHVFMVTGS
jgi:hypothetical protein